MKTRSIIFLLLAFVGCFTACKKQETYVIHSPQETAAKIYLTESFVRFAGNFMQDFYQLSTYLNSSNIRSNRNTFLSGIQEAGVNETALQQHFVQYALQFDQWVNLKNKVDNDWLQLFLQLPELQQYSDSDILAIVKEGIGLGMSSEDSRWKKMKAQPVTAWSSANVTTLQVGGNATRSLAIDAGEIWECLKDAIGVGSASVLGIGALKKLASEGMQAIVATGTRILAKYAGWIGLTIMAIDFGVCISQEMAD
ncbi:MAG: hypothetical protein FGM61_09445 [Sediminibacterium sp.]|nr:hypothetical protein [Sediminibacterium sp.]